MAKTSVVDSIRSDLEGRAVELRGYVKELADIEAALRALDAIPEEGAQTTSRPRRRAASRSRRGAGRAGARAPRGQRREQMVEYVRANPGTTVRAVADELGISPSQAHGLVAKLSSEGTVERSDGRLFPAGASGAAGDTGAGVAPGE